MALMEDPVTEDIEAASHEGDQLPDDDLVYVEPSPSWWQRLVGWWLPDKRKRTQRLAELDWAIDHHPESPSGYVLRGEVYLEMRNYELAADDFRRALAYTTGHVEQHDWGIIVQVLEDRAWCGLQEAERCLNSADANRTGD